MALSTVQRTRGDQALKRYRSDNLAMLKLTAEQSAILAALITELNRTERERNAPESREAKQ